QRPPVCSVDPLSLLLVEGLVSLSSPYRLGWATGVGVTPIPCSTLPLSTPPCSTEPAVLATSPSVAVFGAQLCSHFRSCCSNSAFLALSSEIFFSSAFRASVT